MLRSALTLAFLSVAVFAQEPNVKPYDKELDNKEDQRVGVKYGALPVFNFTTDSGLKAGAFVQRFDYGTRNYRPFENLISIGGSYATQGERLVFGSFERTDIGRYHLRLRSLIYYTKNPHTNYFGTGDRTSFSKDLSKDRFYKYTLDRFVIAHWFRRDFAPKWEFLIGPEFLLYTFNNNKADSQFFRDFGVHEVKQYWGLLRVGLVHDKRDMEFVTSEGYYFSTQAGYAPPVFAEKEAWSRYDADFRYYHPFVSGRWLWLANQVRYTAVTSNAPLPDKARLGSEGTLRGLPLNRYQSNHSLSLRTELRSIWLRHRIFGLPLKFGNGLFLDSGRVGNDIGRLFSGQHHWGYGISFITSYFVDDFLGTLDLGFSEGLFAVYLSLGHAF